MNYYIEDLYGRERQVTKKEYYIHLWQWRALLWPLYAVAACMFAVMFIMMFQLFKELL